VNTRPSTPLKIVLADDSEVFRNRLSEWIRQLPGIEVVAETSDTDATIHAIRECEPDVAILDLRMPGGGGMEVLRQLRPEHFPRCVIVLTLFSQSPYREAARALGAHYFLDKSQALPRVAEILEKLTGEKRSNQN